MDVLSKRNSSQYPHTLYLQLDNCSRENKNKNKYMFAYLAWLMKQKIFSLIQVSFLPTGHTHEDVDQMFSTFGIGKRATPSVATIDIFMSSFQAWYTNVDTRPSCALLYECWSFKAWLEPYIRNITGISQPHVFEFKALGGGGDDDGDRIQLWTKDFHDSGTAWAGPYQYMNDYPVDMPQRLTPAQLDPAILHDVMTMLKIFPNSDSLWLSFKKKIDNFNTPPADALTTDPFGWIYAKASSATALPTPMPSAPTRGTMRVSG
jgi:hypothetical protein